MIVSASRGGTTARQGLQGRCRPEPCATYIIRCALPSIPRFDGSCCERILQQCAKFPRLKAQRRRLLLPTSWKGTWMLHVGSRAFASVLSTGGTSHIAAGFSRSSFHRTAVLKAARSVLCTWRTVLDDNGLGALVLRSCPPVSGVNYFFALTTTISPGQRQLLLALRAARSAAARPL